MNYPKTPNPLMGYFRQPKYYTPIPSNGKWYPHGAIEWPANGELAVYPMTAKDEISMKTPDALLNGQSTVDVIQSCIPAIKDAWHIPGVDLDTLLISIRIASYGGEMEMSPSCPKCQAVNSFQVDLKDALSRSLYGEWKEVVDVEGLSVHLRPLAYRKITAKQIRTFEEQRLLQELQRSDLSETVKLEKFNQGFKALAEITTEIVLDSIHYIELPDGTQVGERDMITEFVKNISSRQFTVIENAIKDNKDRFTLPPLNVKCDSCAHEWQQGLDFDISNFFDQGS